MSQVILYDIPSKAPSKSWSLNPWKPRMVLNFKGVDYKTEWVEYPDIGSTFKSFGIPPNDPNAPGYTVDYTSPVIRFADGTYMMDSWPIAHELEKQYPSPSLHLDDPIVIKIRDHIVKLAAPLTPQLHPKVPRRILSKESAEYFARTRAVRFGMPLEQLEKEKGSEQNWVDVKAPAEEIAELLKKNGGPFFLGNTVSYADLIFVSFLKFMSRLDSDNFERFLSLDPAFGKLYDASKQWLEKDD